MFWVTSLISTNINYPAVLYVSHPVSRQSILIMSRFIQKVNNFFSSGPKISKSDPSKPEAPQSRVISFDTSHDISPQREEQQLTGGGEIDPRYASLENGSLEHSGLHKKQVEPGEISVQTLQRNMVLLKNIEQVYEQTSVVCTNYRLCLQSKSGKFFYFALGLIQKLHKYIENDSIYKMNIELKDGRRYKFIINSEIKWRSLYNSIENFTFITVKRKFFAFRHFQNNCQLEQTQRGWQVYDVKRQFLRMGVSLMETQQDDLNNLTADLKILDNKEGRVCSTYPPLIVVPSRVQDDCLVRCAKFRSRERMPALTYAYQFAPASFSYVFRSSQGKSGMKNSRSEEDEAVMRAIGNLKSVPKASSKLEDQNLINCQIYDARNYYAALGNRIAGKGYESTENYANCRVEFLNISNIHAVRESYNKMIDTCLNEEQKFIGNLIDSKWYEYIFLILAGALDLAKTLSKGTNCLVHCSDGWDRTSQLCSIGALFLDPYYRTITGFEVLIEKDWIYFGHQFAKRLNQGYNDPLNEEKSQVFLQFLDCISQVMFQFPSEFEFNYRFLADISSHLFTNLFGNFLCNSYLQMTKNNIFNKTISLWSKLNSNRDVYKNPYYNPTQKSLLDFDANQKNLRIWREYFYEHTNTEKDVYGFFTCEFTGENLEIMHRHLLQEHELLQQKWHENQAILRKLDAQIQTIQNQTEAHQSDEEENREIYIQTPDEGQFRLREASQSLSKASANQQKSELSSLQEQQEQSQKKDRQTSQMIPQIVVKEEQFEKEQDSLPESGTVESQTKRQESADLELTDKQIKTRNYQLECPQLVENTGMHDLKGSQCCENKQLQVQNHDYQDPQLRKKQLQAEKQQSQDPQSDKEQMQEQNFESEVPELCQTQLQVQQCNVRDKYVKLLKQIEQNGSNSENSQQQGESDLVNSENKNEKLTKAHKQDHQNQSEQVPVNGSQLGALIHCTEKDNDSSGHQQ